MKKYQSGSFLVVAVVIIVVMSLVALALFKISSSNSRAVVAEVYGARAYQAAQSGMQVFLTELYPLGTDGASSAACVNQTYNFNVDGLQNCSAVVSCNDYNFTDHFIVRYSILSEGECSFGGDVSSRVLAVEAFDVSS